MKSTAVQKAVASSPEEASYKCSQATEKRPMEEEKASFGNASSHNFEFSIDYHTRALPNDLMKMVDSNPDQIHLKTLAEFWTKPTMICCTKGSSALTLSMSSWYLSLHHLSIGRIKKSKALLFNGTFLHQCRYTPIERIASMCRNKTSLSGAAVSRKLPHYSDGISAAKSLSLMRTYLERNMQQSMRQRIELDSSESKIDIIVLNTDTREERIFKIGTSTAMKSFLNNYAEEEGLSLSSLRFTYKGDTLFLSSIRYKTPSQLGIRNLDVISVSNVSDHEPGEGASRLRCPLKKQLQTSTPKQIQKKHKEKGNKKSSKVPPSVMINLEKCDKVRHSEALSLVFEEADSKFKEIRQTLHAMNIERTEPKEKKSQVKCKSSLTELTSKNDNPNMDGTEGKAGKSRYLIQVGEVEHLHKTTKPSIARKKGLFSKTPSQVIKLDLHGLAKEEATQKLDEKLPEWVDIAMCGSYPWVIQVLVICGGGNQILSETVNNWIRQNENVSKAPKSLSPP